MLVRRVLTLASFLSGAVSGHGDARRDGCRLLYPLTHSPSPDAPFLDPPVGIGSPPDNFPECPLYQRHEALNPAAIRKCDRGCSRRLSPDPAVTLEKVWQQQNALEYPATGNVAAPPNS